MKTSRLAYQDRITHCQNATAKRLLQLIADKKTNLALSADVTSASDLLDLTRLVADEICLLKTHIDIIDDFTPELTQQLSALAEKHQFLIFEDRKFADIGNTVKHQFGNGVFRIADWADMINAHVLPGPGIIEGLAHIGRAKNRGLILLAEMSSAGHLMDQDYIQQTLKMAEQFPDFVIGFITQHAVSNHPGWINFTPGVKLSHDGDGLGQQYITPKMAIKDNGADVVIVGRGIMKAADPKQEAKRYREAAWQAYLEAM